MALLKFPLLLAVVAASIGSICADFLDRKQIGFGVQKLKNERKHYLTQSTSCENVEQYWFADAIVDNFAPIADQQKWAGLGQRYW
jgi:hypothetical protein